MRDALSQLDNEIIHEMKRKSLLIILNVYAIQLPPAIAVPKAGPVTDDSTSSIQIFNFSVYFSHAIFNNLLLNRTGKEGLFHVTSIHEI